MFIRLSCKLTPLSIKIIFCDFTQVKKHGCLGCCFSKQFIYLLKHKKYKSLNWSYQLKRMFTNELNLSTLILFIFFVMVLLNYISYF